MAETVVAALHERASADPTATAVMEKRFGKWVARTVGDLASDAAQLAAGFTGLGVGRGDTVVVMVSARLEWITVDLAVQAIGARSLALPRSFRDTDVAALISESGATTVVVEGQHEADVVLNAVDTGALARLERVIYIDAAGVSDYASELLLSLDSIRVAGADLATMIGSLDAGSVAAVVPSHDARHLAAVAHATIVQAARSTIEAFSLGPKDRVVTARDIADPVERGATVYPALLSGALLAIPESVTTTDSAIHEIAPTYVHVTERWLTRNAAQITVRFDENHGIKSRLAASWSKRTGSSLDHYGSGKPPRGLWRFMISLPVLEELGLEKARAVVVSGSPMPRELLGFYTALGLPVRAALTLPELVGFATIGSPDAVDGWVGASAPGVDIAIEDGRIVVSTAATGTIATDLAGEAKDGGYVVNGDSPEEAAETRLRSVPVFSTAIVARDAASVIVELDRSIASRWATKNSLDAATYRSFSQLPEMLAGVEAAVSAILKRFDLSPGSVTVLQTPLHDVPGALSFGDTVRKDLVAT